MTDFYLGHHPFLNGSFVDMLTARLYDCDLQSLTWGLFRSLEKNFANPWENSSKVFSQSVK